MPTTQIIRVVQGEDQQANLETQYKIPLDEAIGIGNNGAVQVSGGSNVTFTVKDSGGTTWTKRKNDVRSGGQYHELHTRENITDAPTYLTIDASGSGSSYLAGAFLEACGVGAYDTGSSGNGSSTTPAVASFTPTAGALVVVTVLQDSSATVFSSAVTPGTGYSLHYSDLVFSFLYGESKIHTSGAITPGLTFPASRGWSACAISWLADVSKGTAPTSNPRIATTSNNSFKATTSSPWKIQCPTDGASSLGILFEVAPGVDITGITDTGSNTWSKVDEVTTGSGGTCEFWKTTTAPAGGSTNLATIAFTGSTADNFVTFFKFVGTPTDPVTESAKKASGNSASTSIAGATFTPATATALVIRILGVQSNTVTAVDRGLFISFTTTPNQPSPASLMQNNGYGVEHLASAASQQATWTMTGGGPGDYEELSIVILGTVASTDTGEWMSRSLFSNRRSVNVGF